MGPRRTPPFKSDSGGRGTWKEMGQEVRRKSGENGVEEVREARVSKRKLSPSPDATEAEEVENKKGVHWIWYSGNRIVRVLIRAVSAE